MSHTSQIKNNLYAMHVLYGIDVEIVPLKVKNEILAFFEHIQGEICGPIQPL
jgi:hypothetical protein